MHNKYLLSTPLGLLIITVLVGVFLNSTSTSATSASTATASVKVAASCTLTTTGGGNYSATVPNGTSAEIAGSTMSISCNDAGGFALYAVGYSDDTVGNNNMIGTSTNIPTNTSGTNSYWAMKINPTSGTTPTIENSFNNYHIVPDIHTKIASYASSTGTGSLSVNATYKANISSTQLAGNYLGKVKYTLVHPSTEIMPHEIACDPGKICYNPNTATALGEMGKQSASNNASITLWAPNFKRDGYGFAGWNDKFDYSGNYYGPNETITAPSDVQTNGLSLYAVWVKSAGSLQNWNGCSSLASGATTALTDERDNNTYAVAKLADGKCWMIENLRLADKDSNNNDIDLSSTNTHNPSLPLTNSDSTTSNHLSPTTDPTSTAWCTSNSSACDNQSMLATNNTTLFTNNTSSNYSASSNVYSYGNYYNWYSATVGNGKYGSSYGQGYEAPGDICPAGWHLPKGGNKSQESTNEFWQLIVTGLNNGVNPANYDSDLLPYYTGTTEGTPVSNALRSYPNNFVYSGLVNGSSVSYRGPYGFYWSSSANDSYLAYILYFLSSYVRPGTDINNKYLGKMVRCVAGV